MHLGRALYSVGGRALRLTPGSWPLLSQLAEPAGML